MGASTSKSRVPSDQQEVVMITGCSRGGLGHALAVAFAKAGCTVVATARSLSSMEGLNTDHPNVQTLLQLDVTSGESRDAAVAAVLEKHGRLDILVNNAGMHCMGPVAEVPISLLQSAFSTNVFAPICLIQAVLPEMIARRSGKIVNIGSVAAYFTGPWAGGYSATKSALHTLSDSLRVELRPFGVKVIVVTPGAIRSNLEVNATQIYQSLPKWKIYQSWEHFMKLRMGLSQQPGATSSSEFAERTVKEVLKREPPRYLAVGHLSFASSLAYYIPLFVMDFVMGKKFGLTKIPESKMD